MKNETLKNLASTDYDVNAVRDLDPRFEAGKRDALFFHGLGFVAAVIGTIWMYVTGSGNPDEMTYFLGFPVWISGTILIYLAMFLIGMVYISKWHVFSFTKRDSESCGGDK